MRINKDYEKCKNCNFYFQSLERICLKKHYIELKELSDSTCEFVDKKEEFVLRKKFKLTKNNFIHNFIQKIFKKVKYENNI